MSDRKTYFMTWTTYGTWLPGDDRGWKKTGHGQKVPQPLLADWVRERLLHKPVVFDVEQRALVDEICRRHCEIKGWQLHALNVRSNHLHIVVTADASPKVLRNQFKSYGTRALRASCPIFSGDRPVWTSGGDCELIDSEEDLQTVCHYVLELQ